MWPSERSRLSFNRLAARVSFRGASLDTARYLRLCSPSPLVSIITLTWSFRIRKRTRCSGPVSGNQESSYFPFSRSTMAFFTMAWQSGTL